MNRDGCQQSIATQHGNNVVTKILIDFGRSGRRLFGSNKNNEALANFE